LESHQIKSKDNCLETIVRDLSAACSEVRTISHNLNNFSLSMGDFENNIRAYVLSFENNNLKVSFQYTQNSNYNLSEEIKHHVLRIIQELVSNVVKHANASIMNVGLLINENMLIALIEDNGSGFDKSNTTQGIGLKNVQMRVNAMKGELEVFTLQGKSTQISIHVPLIEIHENTLA
jgi:two-component system, NarL family, sensor kinase